MTAPVVISARELGVCYKRRGGLFRPPRHHQAFRDVSFDLHEGETLALVGRNGAGKSSLLKVLAGILRPDQGELINNGVSVSLLTLQAGFDGELPGTDNAVLSAMLLGYSREQARACLSRIAEFSELGDFMEEPVKTYSAGMRARLGFSVAMFLSPGVLLIDEALSVGDRDFRRKAEFEMSRKIHSKQTVVLVSHSESQVKKLADRVIDLDQIGSRYVV